MRFVKVELEIKWEGKPDIHQGPTYAANIIANYETDEKPSSNYRWADACQVFDVELAPASVPSLIGELYGLGGVTEIRIKYPKPAKPSPIAYDISSEDEVGCDTAPGPA